jgi:hypothetical protein
LVLIVEADPVRHQLEEAFSARTETLDEIQISSAERYRRGAYLRAEYSRVTMYNLRPAACAPYSLFDPDVR